MVAVQTDAVNARVTATSTATALGAFSAFTELTLRRYLAAAGAAKVVSSALQSWP